MSSPFVELRSQPFVIQHLVCFLGLGLIGKRVVAFELLLCSWGLDFIDRDVVCLLVISSIARQVVAVKLSMSSRVAVEVVIFSIGRQFVAVKLSMGLGGSRDLAETGNVIGLN